MTDAAITIDRLEAFQVTLHVASQVAFNLNLVVRDGVNDFVQLLRRKVLRANVRVDVRLLENASGRAKANSVDLSKRRFDSIVRCAVGSNFERAPVAICVLHLALNWN